MQNLGCGKFINVAAARGLTTPNRSARQTNWIDYDGDGDLDLIVVAHVGPIGAQQPQTSLSRNDGERGFTNTITRASPLNVGDHSAQFVDYDRDGPLDLSLTDSDGRRGGHFLFRNTLPERDKRRRLRV